MDEIDWIKNTKKALILMAKVFIGFAIFVLIITLIRNVIKNEWEYIDKDLLVVCAIGIPLPVLLAMCYIIMYIIEKIINSGRKVINLDKNYIREIPKNCSPAISSLIYDLKIDVYKDYTATILYLCTKKYIDIEKDGNSYKLRTGEQKDYSKLGKCEKYVLTVIINKSKFDENQFKQEIIKEAQEKLLITDKAYTKGIKIVILLLLAVVLLIISYNISKIIWTILLSIFGAIVYANLIILRIQNENYIINTEYIRTKKGKELALKLGGLKNYIKEYTLIKDKEIDYIQILEDYIPYAISLDEADTIEEFIKYNEEYRDLIYNRKIDKF